ncbi:MAG TPA: YdeI/OmpD-associated family protein, partial [Thermomicrobiales bacterium]|nr:YdeI/OmpD-associated family protein [Thermomicrobiales bacterium]
TKGHTAMARYLTDEHGVSAWWAQTVTNRYEWERGLRVEAVVPDDLAVALEAQSEARTRFDALATTHRHEYIRWINDAKRPETRARRVAETVANVMSGRTKWE